MTEQSPDFEAARQYFLEGLDALNRGDFAAAADRFARSLEIIPDRVSTLTNLSAAQIKQGKFAEARTNAARAVELDPENAQGWLNVGLADHHGGDYGGAVEAYDRAIALRPDYAEAWSNKGVSLNQLNRYDEALEHYDRALELQPDHAEAWCNKGVTLNRLKRYDEALEHYQKAIQLQPGNVEAWSNKGSTFSELKRFGEALEHYDEAIRIDPEYAGALSNKGIALNELKRHDEALNEYRNAIRLRPDMDFVFGDYLHTKMQVCEWRDFDADLEECVSAIRRNRTAASPFPLLSLIDDPALHKLNAVNYVRKQYPPVPESAPTAPAKPGGKIRIGYYSADFQNHATSYLMAQLFEEHDRERFEIYGFSFGPDANDEMRRRVSSSFTEFFDVRSASDSDIATLSRDLGIDIGVDLKGFTRDARTGIFARRCAPVQVSYLGYPGTMGAPYIDYIVTDRIVTPADRRNDYTEEFVYMPGSYQVNDLKRRISPRTFTKKELGLPDSGFVFCCFNNNYKITPDMFSAWMRILNQVPDSVLWLFEDNASASANLRKEAEARGVGSERLIFAGKLPLDEHLARLKLADLFLDTFPYNAHTTASDALWAGLPILTMAGKSFASRVAASLLDSIGLPELVTGTIAEYETAAVGFARMPGSLGPIRERLISNRATASLFDGKRFAADLEKAFAEMFDRHRTGRPPAPIDVAALAR
jgi:predicted O-linked N-acetylglucosamine transferase (SPINDLY family)